MGLFSFLNNIGNEVKVITYEWNLNYFGHDFSDTTTNDIDMRKCKKCNIYVHHNMFDDRYNTFDYNRCTYPTLNLTCEEVIIKKLLE